MKQFYERIVAFIDGLDKELLRLHKAVRDTLAVWVIDDTNYKNVTLDGKVIPVNDFIGILGMLIISPSVKTLEGLSAMTLKCIGCINDDWTEESKREVSGNCLITIAGDINCSIHRLLMFKGLAKMPECPQELKDILLKSELTEDIREWLNHQ